MKVCGRCGTEIDTRDGDNLCEGCRRAEGLREGRKVRAVRLQREKVLHDLGLVKVRGALGGTYWE